MSKKEERVKALAKEFNELARKLSIECMGAHTFEFDKKTLLLLRDELSYNSQKLIWVLEKGFK